jgi:hypothetical protein
MHARLTKGNPENRKNLSNTGTSKSGIISKLELIEGGPCMCPLTNCTLCHCHLRLCSNCSSLLYGKVEGAISTVFSAAPSLGESLAEQQPTGTKSNGFHV